MTSWLKSLGHLIGGSLKTSANHHPLKGLSAQLETAAEIGKAAASSKNLTELVETITQVIADRFGFYHVSLLTYDSNTEQLSLTAISRGGKKVDAPTPIELAQPPARSIIAHVARTKRPYLAENVRTDPLYLHNTQFDETRSEVAVPVMAGDDLFGVLDVLSNREGPLSSDELNALQVLSNQIGSIIESKRLAEKTSRHLEELMALHAIATAGMVARDEDEFLLKATEVVGSSLFPTNFGVLILDEDRGLLVHHSSYTERRAKISPLIPLGEGITGLVAMTGRPMRIADVTSEPKYISVDQRVRSELAAPLKIGERVLGVLDAESYEFNAFTEKDEHLLLALAGQISTSLERIRLLADAERKAEELAKTLKQQAELARLRSEFIQNVSHEFRTPLSIVGGYIEILDSGEFGPLPDAYRQPVEIIAKRVRLLTKLVEDLTSILDVQTHKADFTFLSLADVVQPLYAIFRTRALAERIDLRLNINPGLPEIRGEETLLRKAIDNLVDNAIKFTPPEGSINIGARSHDSTVSVEVKDTGIGIPKEEISRIFERFYQVDGSSTRKYGGTGLGLALIKEIMDLHGGQITVESEVGKGSTFRLDFPSAK
ncbi:MAG: GAF domain-containing protein [Anaerolineales bacterium]